MTKAINSVNISGNAAGKISYNETASGVPCCSFSIASDRRSSDGPPITAWVKINAYGPGLVGICRDLFEKGAYVIVSGELMTRDGLPGSEVRAKEIVFTNGGGHSER